MMEKIDLKKILVEHTLWLKDEGGNQANLSGANLSGKNLCGVCLHCADLSGVNFEWAKLSGADFGESNLKWVNFYGADLGGADLREANLRGADFREANFSGADLRGAYLSGADLRWAILRRADLRKVDLRGANLSGADFSEADLRGAVLDFSALPLWCGSLEAKVDERIIRQIVYHTIRLGQNSEISCDLKGALFTKELIEQANLFHRVESGDVKRIEDETLADSVCTPEKTVATLGGKD